MLVREAFSIPKFKFTNREVGIEIEMEFKEEEFPFLDNSFWKTERDNSLRRAGAEYVLKYPVYRKDVGMSLYEFSKGISEYTPIDSDNAGVHVHINVQELSVIQLFNMIVLSCCFEELLLDFCGHKRKGNLFCLSFQDAEQVLEYILEAAKFKRYRTLYTDDLRYSFLNMKAIKEYGSLEFRSMRSDGDLNSISTWISLLLCLKDSAENFESPLEIVRELSLGGEEKFLKTVFKEFSTELEFPNYNSKIMNGVRLIQDVVYCCDWKIHEEPSKNIFDVVEPNDDFIFEALDPIINY